MVTRKIKKYKDLKRITNLYRGTKMQEFEEYIRSLTISNSNASEYISATVAIKYYPFTNKCPINGNDCKKEKCFKYMNGQCLDFEINRVIYEELGHLRRGRIFSSGGGIRWSIHLHYLYNSKYVISLSSENSKIMWQVLKDLNLDENFEANTYPPGIYFSENYESLDLLRNALRMIMKNKNKISNLLTKYFTCIRCKVPKYDVTWYNFYRVSLCEKCKEDLIRESLKMFYVSNCLEKLGNIQIQIKR